MRKSFSFAAFAAVLALVVATFASAPARAQGMTCLAFEEGVVFCEIPLAEPEVMGYRIVPRQRGWPQGFFYEPPRTPQRGFVARDELRRQQWRGYNGGHVARDELRRQNWRARNGY